MSIRYFATNRNHESLATEVSRSERLSLESNGYFWVNMESYMSHYLATTDDSGMPKAVLVDSSNRDQLVFEDFLAHKKIGKIVICVHGFNVNFHNAQTWFSILTDTLRNTKALKNKVVTDPVVQDKKLLDSDGIKDGSLTAFVGFSWPSNGSALSYPSDQREAMGSGIVLANLITRVRQKSHHKSINLICHSMGNYLACHMFKSLIRREYLPVGIEDDRIKRNTNQYFVDRYIMLAPDVERRHMTKCVVDINKIGQDDEEVTYLGPFYSGLEHLVSRIYNFYSRFDGALAISNIEKAPQKAAVAAKGVFDSLTFGMLDFLERNPDEKWEQRLGATQHPIVAPRNMESRNAVELSGREIGHSDYIDSQEIAEEIAIILAKP